jgi:hypothetical protein
MPPFDAFVPALVVAATLVVLLSFTFGTQRNIARGNAVVRWLQESLPRLGERTTLRWLGSSVVELRLVDPGEPFRDLTIMAVMEPRDVPILWAFTRARGRRDVLIFRGSLRRAPLLELDVSDPHAWITASDADDEPGWRAIDWPDGIRAREQGRADPLTIEAARVAWRKLAAASAGVWRLSVRQTVPHLEIHVRPPDVSAIGSTSLVETVREIAIDLTPSG